MYIEKIKSPADLKKLDLKELQVVADETRQAVLNRVSKHGGHVGPNLGFVEATVALHYVFNAPKYEETRFLTTQPVDMEFQSILYSNIVSITSQYKAIFLS